MSDRATRLAFMSKDFDRLKVGHTFRFVRTFNEGDIAMFCGVTGDFNPYHTDATFCASTTLERPVVPGVLTGSMITHIGGLLGALAVNMRFDFLAPVYAGDTITCLARVESKDPERRRIHVGATLTNQNGVEVAKARFEGLPGRVRIRPEEE